MEYKTRNQLILLLFNLIIGLGAAGLMFYYFPGKEKKLTKQIAGIEKSLNNLAGIEEQLAQVQKLLGQKEERLKQLDKQVRSRNTASYTYDYLNKILHYAGDIKFDIVKVGSKTADGYKYNVYNIKGETSYQNFFRLIWYLERGPEIFKIERLNVTGVESKDPLTNRTRLVVPFEMELWALYSDVENIPPIKRTLADVRPVRSKNPFRPLVYRNLTPNTEGLVEPERAELKGIVGDKAFVANYDGKIHVLHEGDPVYLGYVAKIDAARNQVIFTLNKGGLIDHVTLKLRFSNDQKTPDQP
ncbi:MAG: hypothetical protein D6715_01270 [Calditrichaeota bacterium]|nr:MAG: hypothetical protein D6715_01270 [Calditrichota bacterium]